MTILKVDGRIAGIRMHEKHLNIATCKWWFPFISVLKKQHVSNGCKMEIF